MPLRRILRVSQALGQRWFVYRLLLLLLYAWDGGRQVVGYQTHVVRCSSSVIRR